MHQARVVEGVDDGLPSALSCARRRRPTPPRRCRPCRGPATGRRSSPAPPRTRTQPRHAGIHLKPVRVSSWAYPRRPRSCQQPRRHIELANTRLLLAAGRRRATVWAPSRAPSLAVQHAPRAGGRVLRRHGCPGRRRDRWRARCRRPREAPPEREVQRAGLFRVGEVHRGEVRIRLCLNAAGFADVTLVTEQAQPDPDFPR